MAGPLPGSAGHAGPAVARYRGPHRVEDVTLGTYTTYGLQCLCHQSDAWVQIRVIRDISTYREPVLHLANQLNACHLSPLHFEEVVLDHIGR